MCTSVKLDLNQIGVDLSDGTGIGNAERLAGALRFCHRLEETWLSSLSLSVGI